MFFLLQEFVGEISVMIKSIETQTKIVLNGASISGDQPQSSLFDGSCCGNFAPRSSITQGVNIAPGKHPQSAKGQSKLWDLASWSS